MVKRVLVEVLGYAVESQRALSRPAVNGHAADIIIPDQIAFPTVAEISGRSPRLGALLLMLPLVSIIAFIVMISPSSWLFVLMFRDAVLNA